MGTEGTAFEREERARRGERMENIWVRCAEAVGLKGGGMVACGSGAWAGDEESCCGCRDELRTDLSL